MKQLIFLGVLSILIPMTLRGQVVFNEPASLTAVLQKYVSDSKSQSDFEGWRIQVLATTDRRQMETAYRRCKELFPDLKVDWIHQEPYYKIKAGTFFNRRGALATCQEIRQHFGQALPVIERIAYEDIIK